MTKASRMVEASAAYTGEDKPSLADLIGISYSTFQRKVKSGEWTLPEIGMLARHFGWSAEEIASIVLDMDTIIKRGIKK